MTGFWVFQNTVDNYIPHTPITYSDINGEINLINHLAIAYVVTDGDRRAADGKNNALLFNTKTTGQTNSRLTIVQ